MNEMLVKLLHSIGIEVAAPGAGTSGGGCCFFTNAIMTAYRLPRVAFRNAVERPNGFLPVAGITHLG
jgi:hypothetical protein